jgi:pimeloyl-ACP methyl ester carboxylesterase
MYGESLGARVAQRALAWAPTRVDHDGAVDGLDALVSVGTPGGRSLRKDLLGSPEVVSVDCWQDLVGDEQAQLWFLDHDADPVTRWDGALAWRYPQWLRRPRGRGIPQAMNWVPVLTWWQVLFDLVFAAQQQSGRFRSVGHDYRADVVTVLAQVLDAGLSVSSVIGLLERREVERDRLLEQTTADSLPR